MKSSVALIALVTLLLSPCAVQAKPGQGGARLGLGPLQVQVQGRAFDDRGRDRGGNRGGREEAPRAQVSVDQAIRAVRARSPGGELLDTSGPYMSGGRLVYRISWREPGRRVDYLVDAQTGRVIGEE